MDFINTLVAQFYAIPAIAEIVNGNAILRIATKQYGGPLLGLVVLFVVLMLVLILSRLGKKSNKPKPVREKKQKNPKKAPRQKAAKTAKVKGPNKAIMNKLAKLPASSLPLYPVADKRKGLEDALAVAPIDATPVMMNAPLTAPEAVLDDANLIEGLIEDLDGAPEPIDVAPPVYNNSDSGGDVEVKSFSLNETTAATMMADNSPADDDFEMPTAPMEEEHFLSVEPQLTAIDDEFPPLEEEPPLEIEMALDEAFSQPVEKGTEGQTIDPVPSLDFDTIEPLPPEEPSKEMAKDDGDPIDIPVGSFGSGDDDLSGAAQEKLAELNDRGVT